MIKKRIVFWLSLFIAIILFIYITQIFFFRYLNSDQRRIESFYMEKEDSLDVVFLGASELFADFSCVQAYRDYGFTSFPYATSANPVSYWKYELKDIIERQHPSLIIIETNGVVYDKDRLNREGSLRRIVNSMPDSENKTALIRKFAKNDEIYYRIPFLMFHERWEHPKDLIYQAACMASLYKRGYSLLKGLYTRTDSSIAGFPELVSEDDEPEDLNEDAKEYLEDFLNFLKDEGIDNVVFVRFPHRISDDGEDMIRYRRTLAAGQIIEKAGFDFVNFDYSLYDIGIEPEDDFYNNEHLNARGMKKMTSYFCDYLMEHYPIEPKVQSAVNTGKWDECASYIDRFYEYFEDIRKNHVYDGNEIEESPRVIKELMKMENTDEWKNHTRRE